jgi:hypothetical protein
LLTSSMSPLIRRRHWTIYFLQKKISSTYYNLHITIVRKILVQDIWYFKKKG